MTKCSTCASENPEGYRFCLECGGKLPALEERVSARVGSSSERARARPSALTCPTCGTIATPSSRFCMRCGTAIDAISTTYFRGTLPHSSFSRRPHEESQPRESVVPPTPAQNFRRPTEAEGKALMSWARDGEFAKGKGAAKVLAVIGLIVSGSVVLTSLLGGGTMPSADYAVVAGFQVGAVLASLLLTLVYRKEKRRQALHMSKVVRELGGVLEVPLVDPPGARPGPRNALGVGRGALVADHGLLVRGLHTVPLKVMQEFAGIGNELKGASQVGILPSGTIAELQQPGPSASMTAFLVSIDGRARKTAMPTKVRVVKGPSPLVVG